MSYSILTGFGSAFLFMAWVDVIFTKVPKEYKSMAMGMASGGLFAGYSIFAPVLLELDAQLGLWAAIVPHPITSQTKTKAFFGTGQKKHSSRFLTRRTVV